MIRASLLALLLVVVAAPAVPALQSASDGIAWSKTYDEGQQEASLRNCPILFTAHKDGCGECVATEQGTYPNAGVVNASKQAVCVVGHMETKHGMVDVPQKGAKPVKRCRIYKAITCDDHVNIAKAVYGNFFNGKFGTPTHIWVGPDGKELFRKSGTLGAAEFIKDVEKAVSMVPGPKATKDEFESARTAITEGLDHEAKSAFKKAIEAYQKVSKGKVERLRPMGEEKLAALDAACSAAVDTQLARPAEEEKEARAAIRKIADECKPLECAKKAAEALKTLDQRK